MKKPWLTFILLLSWALLALLKGHEVNSLKPFIKAQPPLKLRSFSEGKRGLSVKDAELLELWESILTGRSAPVAAWMKKTYQDLGLKHVFTPSGFHLSAVLLPFTKLSSSVKYRLGLFAGVGILLCLLPGFGALKRMVQIKGLGTLIGTKTGFIAALVLDILFGSFQDSPQSFSYSFLFLGIIYSGAQGLGLIFWFFIAQLILAHFQASPISPLLFFWGPLLNAAFSLIMPLLFILAFPLWQWQLKTGLFLLDLLQRLIITASGSLAHFPVWEIHSGSLALITFFLLKKKGPFLLSLLAFSHSLNMDVQKIPSLPAKEFHPKGRVLTVKNGTAAYENGKCRMKLIQGFWWEACAPSRLKGQHSRD